MQGSSFRTNLVTLGICTVALIRGNKNILVDTGHFGSRRQIVDALNQFGLSPLDIDQVILTHSHWDHVLNLEIFENATVLINSKELDFLNPMGKKGKLIPKFIWLLMENMKIQKTIGDQKISKDIRVIETPGHSLGHQAVEVTIEKDTALLTGDAMPTLRSYYRKLPDFIHTTEEEAKQSIIKLREMNPNIYYPGHDRPFCVVNGKEQYLAHSKLTVIFRREIEENFGITLCSEDSEKIERI